MPQLKDFSCKEDSQIWSELKKGDKAALSFIYEQYAAFLFNYGFKLVQDREIINDCIQEVFINIWRYRANICETNSIKNYLFKSFRREVFRNTKLEEKVNFQEITYSDSVASIEEQLIIEEEQILQKNILRKAISLLPMRQKEVIHLKYTENLPYSEIASIMKLDTKSVYKLLYKALARLHTIVHQPSI